MQLLPHQLKKLRQEMLQKHPLSFTMEKISERMGLKVNSWYAGVESGKKKVLDKALKKILMQGFYFSNRRAEKTIARWQLEDVLKKLDIKEIEAILKQYKKGK